MHSGCPQIRDGDGKPKSWVNVQQALDRVFGCCHPLQQAQGYVWGRLRAVRGRPRMTDHTRYPLSAELCGACSQGLSISMPMALLFLRNKRSEWEDYRRQVTEFERRRYIEML